MSRMSDVFIYMCEELSSATGISFDQASNILMDSKVVRAENFDEWLVDVKKIVKLDTVM